MAAFRWHMGPLPSVSSFYVPMVALYTVFCICDLVILPRYYPHGLYDCLGLLVEYNYKYQCT
jgi:hypothetical protein